MKLSENLKIFLRYPYSLIPYKYRLHPSYYLTKNFLDKKKSLRIYQLKKLKEIIEYAYINCPGYFQLYKESNIKPKDLRNLSDIKLFPYITKEILRDNLSDFVSRDINLKKKCYVTTSGSSGVPFGFYNTKEENAIELAFIHNSWEAIGWKLGDKSIVLRGSYIGSEKKISYYNPSTKELHISSYYLKQKTYNKIKNLFFSSQIQDIQAFPSAAINLANLVIDNNDIGKIHIRFIFLGSENFNTWQEKKIYKAFPGAKIFAWYGLTEKCAFAIKHPKNDFYKIHGKYGYSEILRKNRNNKIFFYKSEIVSTSFFAKATPFVRYRTLDYATGKLNQNESISKIYRIEGRNHEFILSKSKKKIYVSSWASIFHDKIFDNINEFQFFQKKIGHVTLIIIPKKTFNDLDEQNLFISIKKKFKNDLEVRIKKVITIKKKNNNKYSFINNIIKN